MPNQTGKQMLQDSHVSNQCSFSNSFVMLLFLQISNKGRKKKKKENDANDKPWMCFFLVSQVPPFRFYSVTCKVFNFVKYVVYFDK